ncbi:MAG: S41 family peptidase [Candidatus Magasanikbacteria bacterium]
MKSRVNKILLIIVGLSIIFGGGVFAGMSYSTYHALTNEDKTVDISKVIDLYSATRSSEVSFDQFWDVWDKIKQKYVYQPVSDVDLFYGSLQGLVAGLHDPYSIYFPPEKAKEFTSDLAGEFEGIGAEIGKRDEQLVIIAPLSGSPAEKAGLHPLDKILAIDGQDTNGLDIMEAITKIRGPKGSTVTLTITQNGFETAKEIPIIRDTINVPTVKWNKDDNGIIHLQLLYFNDTTWTEFDKATKEILLAAPEGIVLDMRTNPGGYLDTSVRVASEWISSGTIVSERFNDGKETTYTSEGQHRLAGIPTVVLIDEGTASGAEIVAGALQDHKVATLVGNKSFGKGSVQDFEVLPDGSALKLTIAEWYTPLGRQINNKGIDPDVVIEEMFVQKQGTDGTKVEDFVDKGLEKAMEVLKETGN